MFEPSDHTRKHLRSNFQVPATPDFITTFLVIADIIKACRPAEDNSVPDRESQTQSSLASNKLDDMNLTGSSPPPSKPQVPPSHAVPNPIQFTHRHLHPHHKVHNL